MEWSRHLGEETQLDFGRWISNPVFAYSKVANCLHDAFLLPGLAAADLIRQMEELSRNAGGLWRSCSINPSAPAAQQAELAEAFLQAGWIFDPVTILRRREIRPLNQQPDQGSTIIPTRASYRHFRQLLEVCNLTRASGPSGMQYAVETVEVELLHLDDSHVDSLLALHEGQSNGSISILTSGEVGTLRQWYIPDLDQNRQLAQLLLNRAQEICARAQLRQVMIGMLPAATALTDIIARSGFEPIGEWMRFSRPNI